MHATPTQSHAVTGACLYSHMRTRLQFFFANTRAQRKVSHKRRQGSMGAGFIHLVKEASPLYSVLTAQVQQMNGVVEADLLLHLKISMKGDEMLSSVPKPRRHTKQFSFF